VCFPPSPPVSCCPLPPQSLSFLALLLSLSLIQRFFPLHSYHQPLPLVCYHPERTVHVPGFKPLTSSISSHLMCVCDVDVTHVHSIHVLHESFVLHTSNKITYEISSRVSGGDRSPLLYRRVSVLRFSHPFPTRRRPMNQDQSHPSRRTMAQRAAQF